MKTITVKNCFGGDKEITRMDFVHQWRSHMQELSSLSWDHIQEFNSMRDRVAEIAGEEFDRIAKLREENQS